MGGVLAGLATIGMGQWNASAKAQAASDDEKQNRMLLTYDASQATRKGELEAAKIRMQGSELIAQQRVAYSNSGVDASSGTPLAVMADTRLMNELDAMTAQNNEARKVWGYKMRIAQGATNLQRTYEGLNREVIGDALSGTGQIISGAAGMSGGGDGGGGGGGGDTNWRTGAIEAAFNGDWDP